MWRRKGRTKGRRKGRSKESKKDQENHRGTNRSHPGSSEVSNTNHVLVWVCVKTRPFVIGLMFGGKRMWYGWANWLRAWVRSTHVFFCRRRELACKVHGSAYDRRLC